jgi:transposase
VEVLIGVDPHKATNVIAAINEQGEVIGQRRPSRLPGKDCGLWSAGQSASRSAAGQWRGQVASDVRWSTEAPGHRRKGGRRPAQAFLARAGALNRQRSQERSPGRYLHRPRRSRKPSTESSVQPEDGPEGHTEILRLLTERRDDLVCERTRALNRLHTYSCGTSFPIQSGSTSLPMPPPNCCAAPGPSIRQAGSADSWPQSWCEMCAPWISG